MGGIVPEVASSTELLHVTCVFAWSGPIYYLRVSIMQENILDKALQYLCESDPYLYQ